MEYNVNIVGNVIRQARENCGMSQTVLADLAVITRSHLSDIENGICSPNLSTFWRIAYAMNLRPSRLVEMAEERMHLS